MIINSSNFSKKKTPTGIDVGVFFVFGKLPEIRRIDNTDSESGALRLPIKDRS